MAGLTIAGVSINTFAWNVQSFGDRAYQGGLGAANVPTGGLDGTQYTADKPLAELTWQLIMWMVGCNDDGSMPTNTTLKQAMRARMDQVHRLLCRSDQLVEIVDTESNRRCLGEVLAPTQNPASMAGATRAQIELDIVVPAGCWEDSTVQTSTVKTFSTNTAVTMTGFGGGTLPLTGLKLLLTGTAQNPRIVAANGHWVQYSGAIPAGGLTIDLNQTNPQCYGTSTPGTSLMGNLTWGPLARALQVPATQPGTDPQVTVTADSASSAGIQFVGRRRYHTA